MPEAPPPTQVAKLLAAVDPAALGRTVATLARFGTRHTLSATDDPKRGIGAARTWLQTTLQSYATDRGDAPRLQVSLDRHTVAPDGRRIDVETEIVNVVATLPGAMPEAAGRHYYVIGHYDSRASDPMDRETDAPGANDDASGVAVVLELARVLATTPLDATVVFMATAGEEQGLIGADRHAWAAAERDVDIRGVLSNDIVGDPTGPGDSREDGRIRLFSAGLPTWLDDDDLGRLAQLGAASDSPSRQLARFVDTVARWESLEVTPALVMRRDRFLRGGDHTAFNRAGFPAVRFTEMAENYDRQHQDVRTEGDRHFGDLPTFVDANYLAGVAKLNAAALIHLANAPAPPSRTRLIAAELTNDATLRWSPGEEPDLAGYEVVRRSTISPQWEHVTDVGMATEATLPLSKDDWFFGVRAYDETGYRSPVAFPAVAKK